MTYSRHSSTHQVHTKTPVLSPKPAHSQLSHLSEMCLRNVLTNSERRPARTSMRSPPQRRAHARWQATSNKASPRSARTGMPKKRHGPQTLLPQGPGTQGTLAQKDLPHHVLQVCQRDLLQCQKTCLTMSCRCVPQCVSLNILGPRSVSSFVSQRHIHMRLYVFICFYMCSRQVALSLN